mmetsp:Transcript_20643/g.43937  ORF Transcript_20643/g.43937 Transcript_20643/m.43937 type:complete len:405 (+) Transcript_20643:26-1240(+)
MMPHLSHRWLIFYHDSIKNTAEKVLEVMGDQARLSKLQWNHFDDGFPSILIDAQDRSSMEDEDYYGTCFLVSFHSPEVIFEQLCLLYELPRLRARNLRIILPWFSTATMERVETLGRIATAESLVRMLSCCPLGPHGPATIVTYDIHWLQEEYYFTRDQVLVELKTAVQLFREVLEETMLESPEEDIAIAFDAADMQIKAKFPDFPYVILEKVRDGDRRIVTIRDGDPAGKHCILVDDLVQSGGTLLEMAAQLRSSGALKISCMSTHGVFAKQSFKKFLGNELIHRFWITDSVPTTAAQVDGKAPFVVLSLAPLIGNYLQGLSGQESRPDDDPRVGGGLVRRGTGVWGPMEELEEGEEEMIEKSAKDPQQKGLEKDQADEESTEVFSAEDLSTEVSSVKYTSSS